MYCDGNSTIFCNNFSPYITRNLSKSKTKIHLLNYMWHITGIFTSDYGIPTNEDHPKPSRLETDTKILTMSPSEPLIKSDGATSGTSLPFSWSNINHQVFYSWLPNYSNLDYYSIFLHYCSCYLMKDNHIIYLNHLWNLIK